MLIRNRYESFHRREREAQLSRVCWTWIAICFLLVVPILKAPAQATSQYRSPLVLGSQADPMMMTYGGMYYLYVNDSMNSDRVHITSSLAGMSSSSDPVLATPPAGSGIGASSCFYIFHWNNHWYQYCADSVGGFAYESATDDPQSAYTFLGRLPVPTGLVGYAEWPIQVGSQLYMLFTDAGSGSQVGCKWCIYAAQFSDPVTISGSWNVIAQPATSGWECGGGNCINEGGSIVVHGNNVYMLFSAGGYESPDYCVGMQTASTSSDLSQMSSWTKYPGCVISRNDSVGAYGPGSCLWFQSPDGTQDWVVYHVKTTTTIDFTGEDRRLEAQQVSWDANGNPVFGQPYALGTYRPLPSGDPGNQFTAPSVSSWGTDRLTVHTIGANNAVWERYWSAEAGWSPWQQVGGYPPNGAAAGPAEVSRTTNYIDVYLPTDDAIWTQYWNGSSWSSWKSLGGPAPSGYTTGGAVAGSRAGVSTWGGDRISLYSVGLDHNVLENYWTPAGWNGWELGPGAISVGAASGPAAYSRITNYTDLFVEGSDGNLWTDTWNGGSWGGWWNFGAVPPGNASAPALASWGSANLTLVEIGRDRNVYLKYWNNGTWDANWTDLGGPPPGAVSDPAVYDRVSNYVDIFVRGADGHIWTNTWDGSSWGGWWDFGGP